MDLVVGVYCDDERCGQSTVVGLKPTSHKVTHLVVALEGPTFTDCFSRPPPKSNPTP
jgi:hypothetical protein